MRDGFAQLPTGCRSGAGRESHRRGSTTLLLILATTLIVALAALVLDVAFVTARRQELQCGCEAACLAAAAQLLQGPNAANGQDSVAILRARQEAVIFAAQNVVANNSIQIEPNLQNFADGDIVVGQIADPSQLSAVFMPSDGEILCNSVVVQSSSPVDTLSRRLFGINSLNATAIACAAVDQRLYGFRPTNLTNAPLVPILLVLNENSEVADRFTVDNRTGQIKAGGDGILEWTGLILASGDPTTSSALWQPDGVPVDADLLSLQIQDGFSLLDFAAVGGQLTEGDLRRLRILREEFTRSTGLRNTTYQSLRTIQGECRVWLVQQATALGTAQAPAFVAGQLVDTQWDRESNLRFVVQPCSLLTPTALVGSGHDLVPGIGKLVLTR